MIRSASGRAPKADDTCRAIATSVAPKLGSPIEFVDGISWRERECPFDAGVPRYFSDAVMHAQSRYQSFDERSGASWTHNEPNIAIVAQGAF
jgi:hypothetical protein